MSDARRPSHGDWDCVLEANQVYEAELAALHLREAGIDARVVDQSYRQEPMPSVRSFAVVRVLVPVGDAAEARLRLSAPATLPEDAREDGDEEP